MARGTNSVEGASPFVHVSNALIWISAVIVMGIASYWISQYGGNNLGSHLIYIEVISVLTVAFFAASFFLNSWADYSLLFTLIFSYLWLVAVVFAAQDWSGNDNSALAHTVEAFSFIAFFFLFLNTIFHWSRTSFGRNRVVTSTV